MGLEAAVHAGQRHVGQSLGLVKRVEHLEDRQRDDERVGGRERERDGER